MIWAIVLLPLLGALIAWFIPDNRKRPFVLPLFGALHLVMTVVLVVSTPPASPKGWIFLDSLGKLTLLCNSVLFLVCSAYAVGYLSYRRRRDNRILCMALLDCLAAMTLVTMSQHLGLLWIALEATTLAMAPLVYFNRNARSIEATWKYLLICSVGIAIALLGLFFLAYSTIVAKQDVSLLLGSLIADAPRLHAGWRHAAFIFLLVGFGSKMGLAPLHTWKPDAYGEAPGLVGALLAGGLVNCALLALLRVYQIAAASTEGALFQEVLLGMGLVSMAFAAVFMARQSDFKRMLAYSSVEHVGIIAVALGLGKGALLGALLHMVNNAMTKGVLFLSSGNIHRAYNSKSTQFVRGALKRAPWSGALFLAAFLAITGSPPFAPFVSEFMIVSSAFVQGNHWTGGLFLLFLAMIFIGMASTVLPLVMGKMPEGMEKTPYRDSLPTVLPPLMLMGVVLMLGLWIPGPLMALLQDAAGLLGGGR
ncbi:proton-conducting transporter membrane subunit [Geomonas sp.]|uniref:proton-conducting transporter transmembrane domain-containing protein n=1 Tax=Geomonas sp. TaxID=2651584 RepID=UPI002B485018|nr:proton-conducting transporter membrane subunit [Geomonas sp.]HJV34471.1 proton-conducting transporter membrane subunit [Geomonas sp.]